MISSLRGTVLHLSVDSAVIEAGGVGLRVLATPTTLGQLREGSEALVYTAFIVREDSMALYGFTEADERDTFNILQSVKGIGPRTALAILAVYTPDILRAEVAAENATALQRVPGIGKKGAARMILELAGKLGPAVGSVSESAAGGAGQPANSDVIAALMNFGWSEADSVAACKEAFEAHPDANVTELLRASLQIMNSRRA